MFSFSWYINSKQEAYLTFSFLWVYPIFLWFYPFIPYHNKKRKENSHKCKILFVSCINAPLYVALISNKHPAETFKNLRNGKKYGTYLAILKRWWQKNLNYSYHCKLKTYVLQKFNQDFTWTTSPSYKWGHTQATQKFSSLMLNVIKYNMP